MKKLEYIPGDLCIVKGKVESVCEVDRNNNFSITTDQHPFIRLSEVKPIPLTPDILKKMGGIKKKKTEVYFLYQKHLWEVTKMMKTTIPVFSFIIKIRRMVGI